MGRGILRSRRERLDTVRATAAWGDIDVLREIRSGRFGKFYPSGAAKQPNSAHKFCIALIRHKRA
jgi:hypothetical protein